MGDTLAPAPQACHSGHRAAAALVAGSKPNRSRKPTTAAVGWARSTEGKTDTEETQDLERIGWHSNLGIGMDHHHVVQVNAESLAHINRHASKTKTLQLSSICLEFLEMRRIGMERCQLQVGMLKRGNPCTARALHAPEDWIPPLKSPQACPFQTTLQLGDPYYPSLGGAK